jgi:Reverse transcriptase (RNA-dependent DNA polymerase)
VRQVLEPLFEPTFHPSSHGFRPGRSCHTAIAEAKTHVEDGHEWCVDLDLEKFFDLVCHQRLTARLAQRVSDRRLLGLIGGMLKAKVVLPDGVLIASEQGVPQGGPLSPLLSNIVLDELDSELDRRGHRFVRYADDGVPRTLKEDRGRGRYLWMRCCIRDEGARPGGLVGLRDRCAGGGRKPPRGALVKSRGAERRGKGAPSSASGVDHEGERKRTTDEVSKAYRRYPKPGSSHCPGISLAGACRLARRVSGMDGGASVIWALVRNSGTCRPDEVVDQWSSRGLRLVVSGENPKQLICEGESSCAGHRGGPSRSSDEGPVIGLERRGRVVQAGLAVNRCWAGGAG